jgi:multidrug resistance protein
VVTENDVGLRSERGPVLLAVMLSTGLIAIDSTIIATAVPSMVKDIGGFTEFPWLFSVYLLAQAVSVPIYGKLNDLFGRKPVILWGIGLFLVSSILCGVAWSILPLIVFRVLQGLGAGAIMPTTITIIGDLYSVRERAKVQGYVASVWGIASVVGPTLGGVFSEWVSWRWIFFVNIPICLLAGGAILRRFHERVERRRPAVDYRGAALLASGLTLVMLGVLEGGQAWAWNSLPSIAVLGVGVVMLVAFGFVERSAPDPVLPLWIFRRRLLVSSGFLAVGVGAILLGLSSYIPVYAQEALGAGPLVAGAYCLVIGLGMGLTAAPTLIAAQSSVGWTERGVVTANNIFLRSLGSALGVAVFGAMANAVVGRGAVDPARLTDAVHRIFIAMLLISVVMVVLAGLIPRSADRVTAEPAVDSPDATASPAHTG